MNNTTGCADCGRHSWYLYRRGICGTCCNAEDARTLKRDWMVQR